MNRLIMIVLTITVVAFFVNIQQANSGSVDLLLTILGDIKSRGSGDTVSKQAKERYQEIIGKNEDVDLKINGPIGTYRIGNTYIVSRYEANINGATGEFVAMHGYYRQKGLVTLSFHCILPQHMDHYKDEMKKFSKVPDFYENIFDRFYGHKFSVDPGPQPPSNSTPNPFKYRIGNQLVFSTDLLAADPYVVDTKKLASQSKGTAEDCTPKKLKQVIETRQNAISSFSLGQFQENIQTGEVFASRYDTRYKGEDGVPVFIVYKRIGDGFYSPTNTYVFADRYSKSPKLAEALKAGGPQKSEYYAKYLPRWAGLPSAETASPKPPSVER